jgi:CheY-like chemotaxis protein
MPSRPSKVLIIDDDESTRVTFAQMLRLEGHEVRTAGDAVAGLDEATLSGPDAIIVDLHMPTMDGLTFVQQLRAREHGTMTPVAIITGDYTFKQGMADALQDLGVTICFNPLWLEDLVKLAGELLLSSGLPRSPEPPARTH